MQCFRRTPSSSSKSNHPPLRALRATPFSPTRDTLTHVVAVLALCLLAAAGAAVSARAQSPDEGTGTVTGTVTDAEEGNPLPGANVGMPGIERGTSTDRDGRFRIEGVPTGTYELVVSYVGREEVRRSISVETGATTTADVALAQGATAMEEVTVSASPITGSQAAALSRQKAAPVVMNVVASDQVGKFPDQNAAAALSRVPGVAVQRDQGQARYINLRGTPQRWTTLAFDGVNVIGSEGRIVRFDEIPAPIIRSIEATKAISPDLPAESVAGRVNVQTASAFDRPGFHVSGETASGYMALSEEVQYNGSAQVSHTFGEKWGVIATAARYKRNQVTNNIESQYAPGPNGQLFPAAADYRVYYLDRTNNAVSGRLDFRPTDAHELFLTSTFVEFNDDEQRNQYVFNLSDAQDGFGNGSNTPMKGSLRGVPMQQFVGPGYYRNSTWTTIAGGTSRLAEWTTDYRASYTRTKAALDLPIMLPLQAAPPLNVRYDYSNPDFPEVDLTTPSGEAVSAIPQTDPEVDVGFLVDGDEEADAYSAQLDLKRSWTPLGISSDLQIGSKVDLRDKGGYQFAISVVPIGPLLGQIGASSIDYGAHLMDESLKSDFPFPNRYNVQRYDVFGIEKQMNEKITQLTEAGLYDPSSAVPDENRYKVSEEIYAGYLMNTWKMGWGSVLAGARLEHARYDSEGFRVVGGESEPVSESTAEWMLFPSVHVNLDLTEDLKLRLAGTSTVSRADFAARRPSVAIDDANRTISGGNPLVRSERSWGADLRAEYYLPRTGIVSASAFGKWVSDPLFTTTTLVDGDRFDGAGTDRTAYVYSAPRNGEDGRVLGVELNYFQQWHFLPGPLAGLGLQANATFLDSEFITPTSAEGESRTTPFPGTSDVVYNTSLFFERWGLSARLSYQWRDDWLFQIDPSDGRLDNYWHDESRLSASVRYALTDQLTVFADANNLTDELGRRYVGDEDRPSEVEGFGRRYLIGLRVNY